MKTTIAAALILLSPCIAEAQVIELPPHKVAATNQIPRPDRIIIKLKNAAMEKELASFQEKKGIKTTKTLSNLGQLRIIEVPTGSDPKKLALEFMESGLVEYAELDRKVKALNPPVEAPPAASVTNKMPTLQKP